MQSIQSILLVIPDSQRHNNCNSPRKIFFFLDTVSVSDRRRKCETKLRLILISSVKLFLFFTPILLLQQARLKPGQDIKEETQHNLCIKLKKQSRPDDKHER